MTPELAADFSKAVRHGYWCCCACSRITFEPKDQGEANLQRCPNCDSARLAYYPPVLSGETTEQELDREKSKLNLTSPPQSDKD